MPKARLFDNGGSQAVRLPAEFRFDCEEVDVRRDTVTGDVVLSKPRVTWDDYFAWVATLDLPADFLIDRDPVGRSPRQCGRAQGPPPLALG